MITTYVIGANGRPTIEKRPGESLVYGCDFVDYLAPGVTIASVVSVTVDAGITKVGAASHDTTAAGQRISGGTVSKTYRVTFVITTSAGDTVERSVWLAIV